jgi:hypothetical protein
MIWYVHTGCLPAVWCTLYVSSLTLGVVRNGAARPLYDMSAAPAIIPLFGRCALAAGLALFAQPSDQLFAHANRRSGWVSEGNFLAVSARYKWRRANAHAAVSCFYCN